MRYLTAADTAAIHQRILEETGGAAGVRDVHLLESAVGRPQAAFGGNDMYGSVYAKAAALMESLIRNHAFVDGNKRTAFVAATTFLALNGIHSNFPNVDEAETFICGIATGEQTLDTIAAWLKEHAS